MAHAPEKASILMYALGTIIRHSELPIRGRRKRGRRKRKRRKQKDMKLGAEMLEYL